MCLKANRTPFSKMPHSNNKDINFNSVNNPENSHISSNFSINPKEKTLRNHQENSSKKFKILHWNCKGACKKFNFSFFSRLHLPFIRFGTKD